MLSGADTAVIPALFVVEVRGALARLGFDSKTSAAFVNALVRDPHEVITLGPRAARAAANLTDRPRRGRLLHLAGSPGIDPALHARDG